jgi:hypothetical protein
LSCSFSHSNCIWYFFYVLVTKFDVKL